MEKVNDNSLVSALSERYADRMCEGNADKTFTRGSIAAAYIVGANGLLCRVAALIRASVCKDGLTSRQADKLLGLISYAERTNHL